MRGFLGCAPSGQPHTLCFDNHANPTPTPTTSTMEPNAGDYNPGHYVVQNREERGRALSGGPLELNADKFRELDVYDKEKWLRLSSIHVPKSKNMKKTTGQAQKEKTPEEKMAQREYCDYLNTLIRLLPRIYYVLR